MFATAMGSTAAALNALATSLVKDWYIPYVAPDRPASHYVAAARTATTVFAILLGAIALFFAYVNLRSPKMTIIPLALGIAGYILGPMLGVFLLGMLTRTRGSDAGNMLALTGGLAAVASASKYLQIEFTWYVFVGASATFLIGGLFRTSRDLVDKMPSRRGYEPIPKPVWHRRLAGVNWTFWDGLLAAGFTRRGSDPDDPASGLTAMRGKGWAACRRFLRGHVLRRNP